MRRGAPKAVSRAGGAEIAGAQLEKAGATVAPVGSITIALLERPDFGLASFIARKTLALKPNAFATAESTSSWGAAAAEKVHQLA